MQQAQEVGCPLRIIRNPSVKAASVKAGAEEKPFELSVTVTNEGDKFAIVDIFIDDRSGPVRDWCSSPDQQRPLESRESCEVVFQFDRIPPETIARAYEYLLAIDARQHYPEYTPIIYEGLLYVQPPVKEARQLEAPTFNVQPATTSETPVPLQPGAQLEFQVMVHNRSYRVDRFRLTCPELAREWFKVIYPEGVYPGAEALELNPGEKGQIQLLLKPPANTLARIYSPTIRLYSANKPDLVLLDLVYIQVAPVYQLDIEFLTLIGQVKDGIGLFELRLHNRGNTVREVNLQVASSDEDRLCTYTLTPERVKLLSGKSQTVSLRVQPKPLWRRPFFGKVFNFALEVEDIQHLPLQSDRFEGALIWEPRPWWHFRLFIILILGLVGAIAFLIWWLLFNPPQPKIIAFDSTSSSYQAGDAIALNWKISNFKKLQTLKLKGISPEGVVTSDPIDYDLSQGIPEQLKNSCYLDRDLGLICQNVPTDALQTGDYTFKLSLIPKNAQGIVSTTSSTNTIRIKPIPQPKIIEFASSNPTYQEAEGGIIQLNWTITHPEQIKELRLIGRAPDGSVNSPPKNYILEQDTQKQITKLCEIDGEKQITKCYSESEFQCKINNQELTCKNVMIIAKNPGDYIFELTAIPQAEELEEIEARKTDIIKIEALVLPKIASLTSKVIEEKKRNQLVNVVLLDWEITNSSQLKELILLRRLPNGKIDPATCLKDKCGETYSIEKSIDPKIKRFCARNNDDELICKNVPQEIEKAGNYIFELIAIPKRQLTTKKEDSQQTEIISIIKIVKFNINNIPVLIRPKQTFIVNPLKPITVTISWKIEGGKKIQVELLPSPGLVTPEGQIIYPLSPKDGSETIMLQVTNEKGEQISRSAIIETSIKPLVPPSPSFPPGVSPSESSDSDSLAPAEFPPKSKSTTHR